MAKVLRVLIRADPRMRRTTRISIHGLGPPWGDVNRGGAGGGCGVGDDVGARDLV